MLSSALEDTLRLFGKERFRPMQRELVECALEGRSCIGILPTGSGKSLCYQIPAVLGNGLTVVVSPLIALMRDQVAGLEKLGVAAARYDSTLAEEDKVALMDRLKSGGVRLLFAAPESLESPWIQQVMEFVPPGLFVVDEAHCLSEWGHSFRPDYLGLPVFFRKHGFRSVMALTATATEQVCRDLAGLFGVSDECIFRVAPYRANIFRQVETLKDQDKTARLVELLKEGGRRPAVVYTRTRKDAENLSYELGKAGFSVKSYHAGMPRRRGGWFRMSFWQVRRTCWWRRLPSAWGLTSRTCVPWCITIPRQSGGVCSGIRPCGTRRPSFLQPGDVVRPRQRGRSQPAACGGAGPARHERAGIPVVPQGGAHCFPV